MNPLLADPRAWALNPPLYLVLPPRRPPFQGKTALPSPDVSLPSDPQPLIQRGGFHPLLPGPSGHGLGCVQPVELQTHRVNECWTPALSQASLAEPSLGPVLALCSVPEHATEMCLAACTTCPCTCVHFHLGSGCACTALSVCAPGASSCPDSLPLPLLGPPLLCWGWGEGEFLAGALERRREGGGEEIVDIAEGAA